MAVWKEKNKWRARYTRAGKRVNVGYFDTKKEAQRAISVSKAKDKLGIYKYEDFSSPFKKPRKSLWQRLKMQYTNKRNGKKKDRKAKG